MTDTIHVNLAIVDDPISTEITVRNRKLSFWK